MFLENVCIFLPGAQRQILEDSSVQELLCRHFYFCCSLLQSLIAMHNLGMFMDIRM